MELRDGEGLSADERRLASALSQLAPDPSAERHAAIMSAVRLETGRRRVVVIGRWRPVLAGLAAAAVLAGTTVGVFAASSAALPSSPAYPLRLGAEQIRLTVAGRADREHLCISFAHARISQANARLSQGDRANAQDLLRDSQTYITEAKNDLGGVSSGEQGQIQNEINQT